MSNSTTTKVTALCSMDAFVLRQFNDPTYTGTRITSHDPETFGRKVNELYETGKYKLCDGYAPFCKHIFIPNFTDAKVSAIEITDENKKFLQSTYEARKAEELPVLVRYFPLDNMPQAPHVSSYLDIILYSREQIIKENEAMNNVDFTPNPEPWGIISVKAQDAPHELPMQPITIMRNALGKAEGGSGVPLDRAAYDKSVTYWKTHAPLK